jgi:D-alanyl-D-alanine carboxypeptidase/D-alanyl-D-alanine-endopeptidase (penicillin-binding protein 4)
LLDGAKVQKYFVTLHAEMKKLLFFAIICWLVLPLRAQDEVSTDSLVVNADLICTDSLPYPENLQQRLNALLEQQSSLLRRTQLGLMVFDLTADSAIYRYNERQTLRPASTMKLLTAITAIDQLGGNYQLRTRLCYTGTVANGTLKGDLWCVGGMDPMFDSDDLTVFVASLRRMGVDTIRGRIIADRSFKEPEQFGEGWCWDDDNPVLSPLLLNRKDDFLLQFVQALRDDGVVADVLIGEDTMPATAMTVCIRQHAIDEVLLKMMKESDNLYAESMFFQVAAAEGTRPARANHARNAVKRMIQKVGLAPSHFKIADGSGLSLYNYVSAELETRLLRYAWRNNNIYQYLRPVLPIAGIDGTLKNRMLKTNAAGNVTAKTGTLTAISSLAGYCTAANGHQLAFCIINQGVLRNQDGRDFQDQVCQALCNP